MQEAWLHAQHRIHQVQQHTPVISGAGGPGFHGLPWASRPPDSKFNEIRVLGCPTSGDHKVCGMKGYDAGQHRSGLSSTARVLETHWTPLLNVSTLPTVQPWHQSPLCFLVCVCVCGSQESPLSVKRTAFLPVCTQLLYMVPQKPDPEYTGSPELHRVGSCQVGGENSPIFWKSNQPVT